MTHRVDVVLGNEKSASVMQVKMGNTIYGHFNPLFQPAVTLNLILNSSIDPHHHKNVNLMLDLKSFEKLRYNVAKALSLTEEYKTR